MESGFPRKLCPNMHDSGQVCVFQQLHSVMTRWTKPLSPTLMLGTVTDLFRSKSQVVAENALLRQQLIILRRQIKRPACTRADRMVLILLTRAVQTWKQALFIVQPDTLLRWHRVGFRWFWKRKSKGVSPKPKLAPELIIFIKEMAKNNQRLGSMSFAACRSSRLTLESSCDRLSDMQ